MTEHCYPYPRAGVTVDTVIFLREERVIKIFLIQRGGEPFKGSWALPGGYIEMHETTEEAAYRELQEETGLAHIALTRVDVFDAVDRDPSSRVISIGYMAMIDAAQAANAKAGDDAAVLQWLPLDALPDLAFDHSDIVRAARVKMGI